MTHHEKGMRLSSKALALQANTPKVRRIARRMLRTWANGWESSDAIELARTMRKDARYLR